MFQGHTNFYFFDTKRTKKTLIQWDVFGCFLTPDVQKDKKNQAVSSTFVLLVLCVCRVEFTNHKQVFFSEPSF